MMICIFSHFMTQRLIFNQSVQISHHFIDIVRIRKKSCFPIYNCLRNTLYIGRY